MQTGKTVGNKNMNVELTSVKQITLNRQGSTNKKIYVKNVQHF